MNAGLSNLDSLKKFLLAGPLQSDKRFDAVISIIGLAVAGLFDTFCNRKLAFMSNDTVIFTGDRPHFFLPRFPLLQIKIVELRFFLSDNWTNISGQPLAWNPETGRLDFGYTLGKQPMQVRVTYTGGYQWEQLEPDDQNFPTALPVLANLPDPGTGQQALENYKYLLPDSVRGAFFLQCQEIWARRDKLGLGLLDKPGEQNKTGDLELVPIVRQMLQPFIRYQMS